MNPSSPLPNPSFTFLPSNQKSSLSYILPQPIPQHPPSPDLPTALSALDHLIHLAQRTIHSISTFIPIPSNEGDLVPCPFNPHHRIPPESLFRHSLLCPAPLDLGILLDSLSYPHTLKSSAESQKQNRFVQTLNSSDAELCFSLDHCDDFGSSIFYRDCPGVVSLLSSEQDSSKKTFTLPAVLSVECANFVSSGDKEIKGFGADCLKLLPSELCAVRGEIESWNDYPNMYSFSVLKVILCTWMVKESDLMRWVIANSPRYGVVIDVPMRDHIFLLFKLCLKAIVREAFDKEVKERNSDMNFRSMRFNCPVLGQILKWLASQLSVLYGEPNGKFFAINMFKQCVSNAASGPSLFLLEQKGTESSVLKEVSLDADAGNIKDMEGSEPTENGKYELRSPVDETIYSKDIFVSQVAAAAAALHERSLLEEKIKGLRFSQPRTRYQIMAEHAYISKKAEEERQKRSDYRPVLEHDGLAWPRSHMQETNRTKTREELLAEERDYKRRRMSYRGKKMKRTTTQVMRDVIEKYMEEIKQAGGIGCFVKGAEGGEVFKSQQFSAHEESGYPDETKRIARDPSEASSGLTHGYREQSHSNVSGRSSKFDSSSSRDYDRRSRGSHGYDEHRSISRDRRSVAYHSRSPDRYSSHGWSHEHSSRQREQNDGEAIPSKHHKNNWVPSSSSPSSCVSDLIVIKANRKLEIKDRRQRDMYGGHISDSVIHNSFEDRYDPSKSYDAVEDDVNYGSEYVRPDK